ncbi:MAG: FAD-dependent oxidoreductase [Clostridia bacterium]|nr:FAD-dependent oxidoreductase [Clostridia bacterium]
MSAAAWTETRQIPVEAEYDVCVVGGGVAGVAAALAAAREGAKTCLIEKEYALGGLATLGLIVIYLPLCDGRGRQVISGISEELLLAGLKYGPGNLPDCWKKGFDPAGRNKARYRTHYEAAPMMIALEELILDAGVTVLYDTRFAGVHKENGRITGVIVENKSGRIGIAAKAFVDATGDADVCFAAGEKTVSLDTNRRTGWYFSNGEKGVRLHGLTDPHFPLDGLPVPGSRFYAGDKHEDVTQHAIDGRRMIMEHVRMLRETEDPSAYPLLIPAYDGMRMTRRLSGAYTLDEKEVFTDFPDSIGLTGDWRKPGPVFAVPWRTIAGTENANIAAAGRCISVTTHMWDITRVIPTAAMTGQAAGTGAAMCARTGIAMSELPVKKLQDTLKANGMIIEKP